MFVFWRCQSALEPVTWQEDTSSSVKASKYICMRQWIGFTRNLKGEDSGLVKESVHPPWTKLSSPRCTGSGRSPWLVSTRTSSTHGHAAVLLRALRQPRLSKPHLPADRRLETRRVGKPTRWHPKGNVPGRAGGPDKQTHLCPSWPSQHSSMPKNRAMPRAAREALGGKDAACKGSAFVPI